jgi:hypothetical protein
MEESSMTKFVPRPTVDPKIEAKSCAICGTWPAPVREPRDRRAWCCEEHREISLRGAS